MVVGFTFYVALKTFLPGFSDASFATLVFGVAWVLLASVLPDIDHPGSLISGVLVLPLFTLFSGHREETHSILAIIISSIIFWIYEPFYGACFSLGYFSHLFADSLTVSGVPFLWGITERRFSFKLMRSGSAAEYIVVIGCIRYLMHVINR